MPTLGRLSLSQFSKSLFSSKGPLNKSELEKQKALSPLYVAAATHAVKSYAPPPKRTGIEPGASASGSVAAGPQPPPPAPPIRLAPGALRTVTAVYDYEGSSIDDLPIAEGEHLTVVETGEPCHIPSPVPRSLGVFPHYLPFPFKPAVPRHETKRERGGIFASKD